MQEKKTKKTKLKHSLFQEELRSYLCTRPNLTVDDQEHLQRWLDVADDWRWDVLVGEGQSIIALALEARRLAKRTSDDRGFATNPVFNDSRKEREATVKAAEATRLLADFYSSRRNPMDLPFMIFNEQHLGKKTSEIIEFHQRQEGALRAIVPPIHRHHVSRQNGGKGKRTRSRECNYFSSSMTAFMRHIFGQEHPHNELVAAMTTCAFRLRSPFEIDDVRSAERAPRRARPRKKPKQRPQR